MRAEPDWPGQGDLAQHFLFPPAAWAARFHPGPGFAPGCLGDDENDPDNQKDRPHRTEAEQGGDDGEHEKENTDNHQHGRTARKPIAGRRHGHRRSIPPAFRDRHPGVPVRTLRGLARLCLRRKRRRRGAAGAPRLIFQLAGLLGLLMFPFPDKDLVGDDVPGVVNAGEEKEQ